VAHAINAAQRRRNDQPISGFLRILLSGKPDAVLKRNPVVRQDDGGRIRNTGYQFNNLAHRLSELPLGTSVAEYRAGRITRCDTQYDPTEKRHDFGKAKPDARGSNTSNAVARRMTRDVQGAVKRFATSVEPPGRADAEACRGDEPGPNGGLSRALE
jgi:hypothetical protein